MATKKQARQDTRRKVNEQIKATNRIQNLELVTSNGWMFPAKLDANKILQSALVPVSRFKEDDLQLLRNVLKSKTRIHLIPMADELEKLVNFLHSKPYFVAVTERKTLAFKFPVSDPKSEELAAKVKEKIGDWFAAHAHSTEFVSNIKKGHILLGCRYTFNIDAWQLSHDVVNQTSQAIVHGNRKIEFAQLEVSNRRYIRVHASSPNNSVVEYSYDFEALPDVKLQLRNLGLFLLSISN